MSLDATVGGAAANSYATQAAASLYFGDRLDATTWTGATTGDKDSSLIMATLRLDTEDYKGAPMFFTQRLKWPRAWVYDHDGRLLTSSSIPQVIQQATFEYALALLKDPTLLGDSGLEGFINVKLGPLDVTPRVIAAAALPAFIKRLIAPVRIGGYGSLVVRA
jgi:hypothetical protein